MDYNTAQVAGYMMVGWWCFSFLYSCLVSLVCVCVFYFWLRMRSTLDSGNPSICCEEISLQERLRRAKENLILLTSNCLCLLCVSMLPSATAFVQTRVLGSLTYQPILFSWHCVESAYAVLRLQSVQVELSGAKWLHTEQSDAGPPVAACCPGASTH